MKNTVVNMSRRNIIRLMRQGKLNPNPIGQRPPIPSKKKPIEIINSMLDGYFTGAIILRDIRNDPEGQATYDKGQEYLVIDGGNRTRAMRAFEENTLLSKYGTIAEINSDEFLDREETVVLYECTAAEATQIFRTVNTVTEVNEIEMIMANEDSKVAKFIRTMTQMYPEYKNNIHDLFQWRIKQNTVDLRVPMNFLGQHVNPRREWDELVAVVLVKCLNGMKNVDAGYPVIGKLVDEDLPLSETVKSKVKATLDTALKSLKFAKSKKFSKVTFGVFQLVYFELMGQGARIIDFDEFSRRLWAANAKLDAKYANEDDSIKSSKKAFGKGAVQSALAKEYIEEMGDLTSVINFSARSASLNEKYNDLALKGFLSADGGILEYDDAEWSHITPHADGGTEATMERKEINHLNLTMEEQMLILQMRNKQTIVA